MKAVMQHCRCQLPSNTSTFSLTAWWSDSNLLTLRHQAFVKRRGVMAEEQDMTRESNQRQTPLLCSMGCGFYGNRRNNGMCSVCYKNFVQRQNGSGPAPNPPMASSAFSSTGETPPTQSLDTSAGTSLAMSSVHADSGHCSGPSTAAADMAGASASAVATSESGTTANVATATKKPKAEKARCFTCRKKVGLTGFDCRCGNVFCSLHRYSDTHNCTFDYRAEGAERLRRENPKVAGEKIQKL
ncbi:AN1-type zinc finger protein 6-like [Cynoglossus semilaevis]|nr:AN1-type zinc finger protein 6-like [Cynoglossus semilaevis]